MEKSQNNNNLYIAQTPLSRIERKYAVYFIESHLKSEDKEIELILEPNQIDFGLPQVINQNEIKINENKIFINRVYKIDILSDLIRIKEPNQPKDLNNKKMKELFLNLKKKDTFKAKFIVNMESNNFLGEIKFEIYKGWFKDYNPPERLNMSYLDILLLFNETLLIKENKKETDKVFLDFIEYGANLFEFEQTYNFELFLFLYINIINGENNKLIKELLDLFNINNIIKQNNRKNLVKYQNKLDNIYHNNTDIIQKIINIFDKTILDFYLIKFYLIEIYFLFKLNEKEKLIQLFMELKENKYDNIILPKLYLCNYSFLKDISISEEIKNFLIDKLIFSSITFNNLETSLSLISFYYNKSYIKILSSIYDNFDKIIEICLKEKKQVNLKNYIKLGDEEYSQKFDVYLNLILTKKKENKFEIIKLDIDILMFFIRKNYPLEFLKFLELKLFECLINYKDIEDSLLFSSKLENRDFVPILQLIANNYKTIVKFCKIERKSINISQYITTNINDDIQKIKELISFISEKEKLHSYIFVNFDLIIWQFYYIFKDLDKLKIIRDIIEISNVKFNYNNVNDNDNEYDKALFEIQKLIHDLGLDMIKKKELKDEKLLLFLGEEETLYNKLKIKNLENENNNLKSYVNNLTNKVYDLENENQTMKRQIHSSEVSIYNLGVNLNKLNNNLNEIKSQIEGLKLIVGFKS